uniref:C1q domain-containing protein n=1 Tax=Gouania willdenowi TaxID=441366 RepID=A0A8C5HJ52_GOUWI
MVQLPPSLTLDIPPSTGPSMEEEKDPKAGGSPKRGGGGGADTLQLSVEFSTAYYDYETYIEDGLICLKHKVRNLEKKKLKLEEYEKKLKRGEELNKDQMVRDSESKVFKSMLYCVTSNIKCLNCVTAAAWNDSSQVSSPDRGGSFTIMDSGLGDSMSVSTGEVPLTPHSQHQSSLVPMQLYPISQPLRVAFTASRTANFAPGNLDQPVVFDQLQSNLGGMYDPHIGRFTCPVNGTYFFIFHILKLAINIPLYVNLMCNEEVMVSAYANDGAPDHETASNHAILPLFQGDQLWLRLHRGAIYGSTWKYSTFSGFLLYQD